MPSFHDANVLSVERAGDVCRVALHAFRTTDRVGEHGHLILRDHFRIRFELAGVSECALPPDYASDILFDIEFAGTQGDLVVHFDSVMDSSWSARCSRVRVFSIRRCSAEENLPGRDS